MHSSATLTPTMSAQPDGVKDDAERPLPAASADAGTAPAATSGLPIAATVAAGMPQYTGANRSWSGLVAHPLSHTQLHAPEVEVPSLPCAPQVQFTPAARLQAPPAPHPAAAGAGGEALSGAPGAAAGALGGGVDGGGTGRAKEKRASEIVTSAREAPSPAQKIAWLAAPPPGAGAADAAATKLQATPRDELRTEASVVPPAGSDAHVPSDAAHGLHCDHDCGDTQSALAPPLTRGSSTPSSVALAATMT